MSVPRGRPRQADLARAAGVSQTTVSLVLNGRTDGVGIAPETVRRVQEIAREMGYVADPIATRLSGRQNFLIGVYTFTATFPLDVEHSYYPFLAGIEEQAAKRGYDLILFTGSAATTEQSGQAVSLDRLRLADGCILFGRHMPVDQVRRLVEDGFPIVYIGRRDELHHQLAYVGADYVTASKEVITRLGEYGHHRITYVREFDEALASTDRERGVREGLLAIGADMRRAWLVHTDGSTLTPDWVRGQVKEGVTAFVVEGSDTWAAARSLRAAVDGCGLHCPEDVSFALLGDFVSPARGEQTVSGFALPRREMGRRSVDLLAGLLEDEPEALTDRQPLLACPPIAGETMGAPPGHPRKSYPGHRPNRMTRKANQTIEGASG